MKFSKRSYLALGLVIHLLPSLAFADFCSKDKADPFFIKETELGHDYRRFDLCRADKRNECEHLGDRYYDLGELKAEQDKAHTTSQLLGAVEIGSIGGTAALAYLGYRIAKKAEWAFEPRNSKIRNRAFASTLSGAGGAYIGVDALAIVADQQEKLGLDSLDPSEAESWSKLLKWTVDAPTDGTCFYLPTKSGEKVKDYASTLRITLRDIENNPSPRVVQSKTLTKMAKESGHPIASGLDEAYVPYPDSQLPGAPAGQAK